MLSEITPLILTLDEAPNIGRTLNALGWARQIVVVDSGSTDGTREILSRYPNVRVFVRPFTGHAEQWNFGLNQTGISTQWILALDADYILSDRMKAEIGALVPEPGTMGYRVRFTYCIDGKPLRAGVYPPVVVLYRRTAARYEQDGHTQRVCLDGQVLSLNERIYHDDRKPLSHWLAAQARYMRLEAAKLRAARPGELGIADQVRKSIVFGPVAMLLYCLIVRGGILDGRLGLFYAMQRFTAEAILSLYLLQEIATSRNRAPDHPPK
jgi:glycosyltransferase involved in cell wall biosynthesis